MNHFSLLFFCDLAENTYFCTANIIQVQYKCYTSNNMATTTKRSATSFRLPLYLLEGLRAEAQRQHRSVNNLVEVFLLDSLYREPNAETLAAMEECRSGVELDELTEENIDNLEEYVKTL